jgi:hypothetical protein
MSRYYSFPVRRLHAGIVCRYSGRWPATACATAGLSLYKNTL